MDTILKFVGKNFMKDQRFEVNNRRKFILVIGVTGTGKSSFINFMTNKDECKVSDEGESCTKDYKIVDIYDKDTIYYFVDTPGLDDSEGDKKNIEEIIKFRNTVPRINAIIYCQSIHEQRVTHSAIDLFRLMKQLFPDPSLFSHVILVRTKSDRSSNRFEENKNKCKNSIYNQLKKFNLIGDEKTIPEYYIDSVDRDNESISEKMNIIDKLEKMDPLFKGIKVKILDHVEVFDHLNNRITIKQKKVFEYTDYDGSIQTKEDTEREIIDLNGIKEVKIIREDPGISKGFLCCKSWKIIYRVFYINEKNEEIETREAIDYWQTNRNSDKSNIIKIQEERRLGINYL